MTPDYLLWLILAFLCGASMHAPRRSGNVYLTLAALCGVVALVVGG